MSKPFWETNLNPITMFSVVEKDSDYNKSYYQKNKEEILRKKSLRINGS